MATIITKNLKDRVKDDTSNEVFFTFLDGNSDPISLVGATIKSEFRYNSKLGEVVKTLEIGTGITVISAADGEIQFDEFILDWQVGCYWYDIQITFSGGKVKTYVNGKLNVVQDITT